MSAEKITSGDHLLALVVRAEMNVEETEFLTEPEAAIQAGLVSIAPGGECVRHEHLPKDRHNAGIGEVLIVRKGSCEADIYDLHRNLVRTVELRTGDFVLFPGEGGHGVRSSSGAVLIEIKQGPYEGDAYKKVF